MDHGSCIMHHASWMMDDGLIEMKTVMLIMVMLIKRLCSVGKPFLPFPVSRLCPQSQAKCKRFQEKMKVSGKETLVRRQY